MTRLDALTVRKDKNGKSWFTKIGTAFENKSGDGYTLVLEALPLQDSEGQCRVILKAPKDKAAPSPHDKAKANGYAPQIDDEIPF